MANKVNVLYYQKDSIYCNFTSSNGSDCASVFVFTDGKSASHACKLLGLRKRADFNQLFRNTISFYVKTGCAKVYKRRSVNVGDEVFRYQTLHYYGKPTRFIFVGDKKIMALTKNGLMYNTKTKTN